MSLLEKIRRHGLRGSFEKALLVLRRKSGYDLWRVRHAPVYTNPTPSELAAIEADLIALGVTLNDYSPPPAGFKAFQAESWFPADYHGGRHGDVWDEKLLEHWLAAQRLDLMNYRPGEIYVDVAACGSPWVKTLRERKQIEGYAIDLSEVPLIYRDMPYYRSENATHMTFADNSVTGASLHCAYEMFTGEDDTNFILEAARILKPGGKVVILPLYMHTHYCAYSTPEYYGKSYSDPGAKEYVRLDCYGVPSSRKYDAAQLKERVLDTILAVGLRYRLLVLRNKAELGDNIYCHFILEIEK